MVHISKHTQGLMIRTLATKGIWRGRRSGLHIRLERENQISLDGNQILWEAYRPGHLKATKKRGRAGTVIEALSEIERAVLSDD